MDGAVIALWITTLSTAIGVIYTVVRNGREHAKQDTELKIELRKEIESLRKMLDDPRDGLSAIRHEISSMKEHCASVTSGFEQRIVGLESSRRKE